MAPRFIAGQPPDGPRQVRHQLPRRLHRQPDAALRRDHVAESAMIGADHRQPARQELQKDRRGQVLEAVMTPTCACCVRRTASSRASSPATRTARRSPTLPPVSSTSPYTAPHRGSSNARPEVGGQRSEVGGRRAEVGGQRSEVGGLEGGGRRSEVGGRRSQVAGRRSQGPGVSADVSPLPHGRGAGGEGVFLPEVRAFLLTSNPTSNFFFPARRPSAAAAGPSPDRACRSTPAAAARPLAAR